MVIVPVRNKEFAARFHREQVAPAVVAARSAAAQD
jgi:hypothetical protein